MGQPAHSNEGEERTEYCHLNNFEGAILKYQRRNSMPPNRPRKGMTVPGSAQHSGSLHSMRKAPFLTDEGLLQRITTLGDPLFNDSDRRRII